MKKVLVASAALMLAGGMYVAAASAAEVKPGVVITGDARVRFGYQSEEYLNANQFGNRVVGRTAAVGGLGTTGTDYGSQTNLDSRVRVNVTGTAAGGTYVKARFRMEGGTGDIDADPTAIDNGFGSNNNSNLWVDMAYVGIPFSDTVTVEAGRYRSTYGPLPATNNFFYDDVSSMGVKGIIKFGDVEVNPFIEYMEEAQNTTETGYAATLNDARNDNDEMRFGVHVKAKINKDWTVGGMLGYQVDERDKRMDANYTSLTSFDPNTGLFASLYTSGKSGNFGLAAELAYTQAELNNFNSWELDQSAFSVTQVVGAAAATGSPVDRIGSADNGFGGYAFPNYQIDKLNIGLNIGFTNGGFQPDRAFGFVMIGTADNSRISAVRIGDTGDWFWGGLVTSYAITDALKLTGNLVYADINGWDSKGPNGDGPSTNSGAVPTGVTLDNAWELSAVLQYTISKGTDLYFSAGYLKPEFNNSLLEDDAAVGVLSRLEVKF